MVSSGTLSRILKNIQKNYQSLEIQFHKTHLPESPISEMQYWYTTATRRQVPLEHNKALPNISYYQYCRVIFSLVFHVSKNGFGDTERNHWIIHENDPSKRCEWTLMPRRYFHFSFLLFFDKSSGIPRCFSAFFFWIIKQFRLLFVFLRRGYCPTFYFNAWICNRDSELNKVTGVYFSWTSYNKALVQER